MGTSGPDRHRYVVLDGLRGVAAIAVMLYHYIPAGPRHPFENAYTAVDFFFILSGFVLTASYGRQLGNSLSARSYLAKRWIRLYPMFVAGLCIGFFTMCLDAFARSNGIDQSAVTAWITNLIGIPYFQGVVSDASLLLTSQASVFPANPPAWSLFFEMVASVAFVWIARASLKRCAGFAAIAGVVYVAEGAVFSRWHSHVWGFNFDIGWSVQDFFLGFARVFFGFTVGVILFRLVDRMQPKKRVWIRSHFLYVGLFLFLSIPVLVNGGLPLLFVFIGAPLVVFHASRVRCETPFEQKLASRLGWFSYPLYCLHYPLGIMVAMAAAPLHLSMYALVALQIIVAVAVSAVVTKYYEEPARNLLSRKFLKPRPCVSVA